MDRKAFRLDRPPSAREFGLAFVVLAILGGLAYAPLVLHGGFHLDDWSNAAGTFYPPGGRSIGHTLDWFKALTLFRPVLVIYVPLTYVVLGMHQHLFLAWAVVLALFGIMLFYGVLRRLGVPWIHALVIAGLLLIYPWYDSTKMMPSAGVISVAIFFLMAGAWVALVGLDRRSPRWHIGAAALYLLSILSYEITLPLIAALGLVYLLRAGWREARWRWAVDLVVVVAGGIWNLTHTARETSGISGDLHHLHEIVSGGGTILGQTVLPTRIPETTPALIVMAVVLGLGLAVWWSEWRGERGGDSEGSGALRAIWRGGLGPPRGWGLREWLLLAGAGIAIFALGWVVFIPANPYYTPVIFGVTNRVNGMAGFGTVVTVYATFGVLGSLIGRLVRGVSLAPIAVTLALAVVLGAGYGIVLHRHIGMWNAAYVAEEKALDQVTTRYPTLPEGSTIIAGNYPSNETLGVPILSATWDFDGMVKDHYETFNVGALPLLEGWVVKCLPEGVEVETAGTTLNYTEYGKAHLMNLTEETAFVPKDKRSCERDATKIAPGPMYLSYEY